MKKVMPRILIGAGILLLLAAVGLFVYSRLQDYMASQRAQRVLEQVLSDGWNQTEYVVPSSGFNPSLRSVVALENPDDDLDEDLDDEEDSGGSWEPIVYSVVGILEIPRLSRRLPVLDRSTYPLLNISVCMFSGRIDEKPVRLVIAGHNLRSHFGEIKNLSVGDEVFFTTREEVTLRYSVIRIDACHKDAASAVQEGDDWDLTLLTCQRDRTMRTLVRCQELSE